MKKTTKIINDNGYGKSRNDINKENTIIINKINKHSLLKLNGYFLYLVGFDNRKNVEMKNATPLLLDQNCIDYLKKVEKAKERLEMNKEKEYIGDEITKQKNHELYDVIKNQHMYSILINSPKPIGVTLNKGKEKFVQLPIEEQIKLLTNIVSYTATDLRSRTFSLEMLGGAKEVGRIRISGNMTEAKELLLIDKSVTGLYEKSKDLLSL